VRILNEEQTDPCWEEMKKPHHVPRGLLRLLILRILKSREMTGSEISQTLEEWTEGEWKPSPGSIYPLLSSLEDNGIIKPVRQEGRSKVYALSKEGNKKIKSIFRHKADLQNRAHLSRKLWLHLMEPGDRAQFHISGMKFGSILLEDTIDSLSASEKKKASKRLEKLIDNLNSLKQLLEQEVT
jgi:DNA-binding PadR family transcriptional regulator